MKVDIAQLDQAGKAQFDSLYQTFQAELAGLRAAEAAAAAPTATEEQKKALQAEANAAKVRYEAIAKVLTGTATGVRDAVYSFQRGDVFAGSAAIMDICSTITSSLAALTAVPGPPAIASAVFSIISMVLNLFKREQESLVSHIDKIVRDIKAEEELVNLTNVQEGLQVAMVQLLGSRNPEYDSIKNLLELDMAGGRQITTIRAAAGWLKLPKNQNLDFWGQVLNLQCQAYIYLKLTVTYALSVLKFSPGQADFIASGLKESDKIQLAFLQEVRPAAGNRGRVWALLGPAEGGGLHVRDVPAGNGTSLGGAHRSFAISLYKSGEAANPEPFLAAFALERRDDGMYPSFENRYRMNNRAFGLSGVWPLKQNSGWKEIPSLKGLHDIAAIPGEKENEVYIYTANGKTIDRWVYEGDPAGKKGVEVKHSDELRFEVPAGFSPEAVCAVSMPLQGPLGQAGLMNDETAVVYAGMRNPNSGSVYIRAYFSSGEGGLFSSPRDGVIGIKTDSTHLWVFGRKFIACTTHGAVKAVSPTLMQANAHQPRWIFYDIPAELGGDWEHDGNYDGLRDLAPCDDGTLIASFYPKIAGATTGRKSLTLLYARPQMKWTSKPEIVIQTTGRVDPNYPAISIKNGWELISDSWANPNRLYKEPIFCWKLADSLTQGLLLQQWKDPLALPARV